MRNGERLSNWFHGGNFNKRLVKKGIIRIDGKDNDGNDMYALTLKGEKIADELITEITKS